MTNKVAITSRNAGSVRTRTVGSAIYNMAVQAAAVIASNVGFPALCDVCHLVLSGFTRSTGHPMRLSIAEGTRYSLEYWFTMSP